ncbi:MAG: ribonuclease N1 [Myxococcales bacterium]|nr:ribonuclease N1 [Myxococcales bacterium]
MATPSPRASPSPSPSPSPRVAPTATPPRAAPTATPPIAAPTPATPAALALGSIADPEERAAVIAVATAIDRGGPFAYRKDGAVFENREGRLPRRARGYWREYTVPTPTEDDRGARRLVAGDRRELYYTRDHYRAFVAVRAAAP